MQRIAEYALHRLRFVGRNYAVAFANREYLIRLYLSKSFDFLRSRPFDLDPIRGLHFPQAKVQAEVALRHDARAAMNFIHLNMIAGCNPRPSADGRAIALGSHQFNLDPVLLVSSDIVKE